MDTNATESDVDDDKYNDESDKPRQTHRWSAEPVERKEKQTWDMVKDTR